MAATFQSSVLAMPEIADVIFRFQFGVYEDVRPAFAACRELTEFNGPARVYDCDASFHGTFYCMAFAPRAAWASDIDPADYGLDREACDARLPLHVAIAKGYGNLAIRIVQCRPDLASDDAFFLAFYKDHIKIAEQLLDQRPRTPELRRRAHAAADGSVSPASPLAAKAVAKMVARHDAKGLALLERFGLRPDDLPQHDMREALKGSTLENATIVLDLFPWINYPDLLELFAMKGFLPLVQLLHQRGAACTRQAMRHAAIEGHFDVAKFIGKNAPEDRTTIVIDDAMFGCGPEVYRFLVEHQTESASPNGLDLAVEFNGRLDVIQYLHGLGTFGCTVYAVDEAARRGDLPVVQFLLTNRHDGCTRDDVVQNALMFGHLRTAEYLLSLGYPFPTSTTHVNEFAFCTREMLGVLQLLVDHGASWDDAWMVHACTANNVPLVKFLHKRMPTTFSRIDVFLRAIERKAWKVVHYLLANCLEDYSVEALEAALCHRKLDVASVILQRQPELRRHDELLQSAAESRNTEATHFLLAAGIGQPRDCLLEIAGRPAHVTESKLVLSYCMDAADHLDNVLFLLELVDLPDRRRGMLLQLITAELTYQGKKVNQTIELAPSVAARATTLLEAGDVVDWAHALVIGHLEVTDAIPFVHDAELQAQLTHLLSKKRKRSTSSAD